MAAEVCPRCGRPLPGAKFEVTDAQMTRNAIGGVIFGALVFLLAMGVGVNFWLSASAFIVAFFTAAIALRKDDERQWRKAQAADSTEVADL